MEKLVEASYLLHSTLDLDLLLAHILTAAADGVGAERGTVFLLDEEKGAIWSRVLSGDETLEIRLPLGQGIAGTVAQTGETETIDDAYEDPRFDRSWDEKSGFRTRAILCAPIRNRGGDVVGVFQLLNKKSGRFVPEDEEFLAALSVNAALAVENAQLHASSLEKERYDREVALAQEVQRQIQPERRTIEAGVLTASGMNELCEDATGDYYDLLTSAEADWLGVAIGDVSGHGLQAALVMVETRAYLRAFVRTAPEPAAAVELLNDFLVPDMAGGKFISLFVAVVDTVSGAMQWCNAGHNPPLLVRGQTREVEELAATGPILGILPGARFGAGEPITLEPGDLLLLYTDGVTEARNPAGDLFGLARLKAMVAATSGDPAQILQTIRAAVREFTADAPLDDDLTLVAVKRGVPGTNPPLS